MAKDLALVSFRKSEVLKFMDVQFHIIKILVCARDYSKYSVYVCEREYGCVCVRVGVWVYRCVLECERVVYVCLNAYIPKPFIADVFVYVVYL